MCASSLILWGEIRYESLLRVEGLRLIFLHTSHEIHTIPLFRLFLVKFSDCSISSYCVKSLEILQNSSLMIALLVWNFLLLVLLKIMENTAPQYHSFFSQFSLHTSCCILQLKYSVWLKDFMQRTLFCKMLWTWNMYDFSLNSFVSFFVFIYLYNFFIHFCISLLFLYI